MSLKSRFLTIFSAAAATAALATFGMAQDQPSTPAPEKKAEKRSRAFGKKGDALGMHPGMRGGMMGMRGMRGMRFGGLRGIQLTDAQKEQIKAIHEANKPNDANREEMKTLMQAKRAGTITAEQEARLKAIHESAKTRMKDVHAQILNVLTAEQKAQIEQRRNQMQQRREEFRQKRQEFRDKRQQGKPAAKTTDTI